MKKNHIFLYIYLLLTTVIVTTCPHDKDSIIEIETQDALHTILTKSQGPVVIAFHKSQCPWCKEMDPMIDNLSKHPKLQNISFYRANGRGLKTVDNKPSIETATIVKTATNQELIGYPFILFMNQGKYTNKQVGGIVRTRDQINKDMSETEVLFQKIEQSFPNSMNNNASIQKCNCK